MRLFYIANIRFPTERAHGIQVAHMCSAFAERHGSNTEQEHGTDTEKIAVTLLVPDRKTFSEDPFEYYGVARNFTIEKIPVPDIVRFGPVGFFIESLVFAYRAAKRVQTYSSFVKGGGDAASRRILKSLLPKTAVLPLRKGESATVVVYTREELPLLFLPRRSVFYETHQLRRSFFFRFLLWRARSVIAISHGLTEALVKIGCPRERILVAPDGYDEQAFQRGRISQEEARRRLSLPVGRKIAMYIGGLEPWKGAETLCQAAKFLAEDNILAAIIGGTEEEINELKPKYPDVRFLGARPYRELPQNQQAADILVIPNSARERISRDFTSPLKLFAHMASGIPVVASRLPSLTEILSEENAYLVKPDDSSALAVGILAALRDSAAGAKKAKRAVRDVSAYSWDMRAGNVLAYIRWQRERKSS